MTEYRGRVTQALTEPEVVESAVGTRRLQMDGAASNEGEKGKSQRIRDVGGVRTRIEAGVERNGTGERSVADR